MEDKKKAKLYFWLFLVSSILAILFFLIMASSSSEIDRLNREIKDINNIYCANYTNLTDVKDIREVAENFVVSEVKNAYNIQFKEIYLVGNQCNSKWWVLAEYDKKIDEEQFVRGASFLEINPINKELTEFITFTCSSQRKTSSDEWGLIENSCLYSWQLSELLGENKQEASNYIDLLE